MKLTAFTDYGLRVLIYLATQPQRRATIAGIADAFGVSEHHLVKVVHFLARAGFITSIRGKGGGLELGRHPATISVGDVVRRMEGEAAVTECLAAGRSDCCIAPVCRLKDVLEEAVQAFHAVLDRTTLADLVGNRRELAQVLFFTPTQRAGQHAGHTL